MAILLKLAKEWASASKCGSKKLS